VLATCQPCRHLMYFHMHDVAGMGKNSRFEIQHSADEFNKLLAPGRPHVSITVGRCRLNLRNPR